MAGLALLALAGAAQAAPPAQPWPDALYEGTFETRVCATTAQWGSGALVDAVKFFHRSYTNKGGQWTARYTFFADAECRQPLFSGEWDGAYTLLGPAKGVPGAREIDTTVVAQRLTVLSPAVLPLVDKCGNAPWAIGLMRDVSGGCTALGPMFAALDAASADYDIVSASADGVKIGYRTPDMRNDPKARPGRLQEELPALRYRPALPVAAR